MILLHYINFSQNRKKTPVTFVMSVRLFIRLPSRLPLDRLP